jgi:hypothetical protein
MEVQSFRRLSLRAGCFESLRDTAEPADMLPCSGLWRNEMPHRSPRHASAKFKRAVAPQSM